MEQPPKPALEYRYREQNGVVVRELTPESDLAHTRWLTACNMARLATSKAMEEEREEWITKLNDRLG